MTRSFSQYIDEWPARRKISRLSPAIDRDLRKKLLDLRDLNDDGKADVLISLLNGIGLDLMSLLYVSLDRERPSDSFYACLSSASKAKLIPSDVIDTLNFLRKRSNQQNHRVGNQSASMHGELYLGHLLTAVEWFFCECETGPRLTSAYRPSFLDYLEWFRDHGWQRPWVWGPMVVLLLAFAVFWLARTPPVERPPQLPDPVGLFSDIPSRETVDRPGLPAEVTRYVVHYRNAGSCTFDLLLYNLLAYYRREQSWVEIPVQAGMDDLGECDKIFGGDGWIGVAARLSDGRNIALGCYNLSRQKESVMEIRGDCQSIAVVWMPENAK